MKTYQEFSAVGSKRTASRNVFSANRWLPKWWNTIPCTVSQQLVKQDSPFFFRFISFVWMNEICINFSGDRLPNAGDSIRGMDWALWRSWRTSWPRRIRSLFHEWAPAAKQIKKSQLLIKQHLRMQFCFRCGRLLIRKKPRREIEKKNPLQKRRKVINKKCEWD